MSDTLKALEIIMKIFPSAKFSVAYSYSYFFTIYCALCGIFRNASSFLHNGSEKKGERRKNNLKEIPLRHVNIEEKRKMYGMKIAMNSRSN